MGREWLYWVGGGGGGGGGMARPATRRGKTSAETNDGEGTSAGCMCAVFQLFDLQQFQFPLNHQHSFSLHHDHPFLQQEATTFKGVEAPRNSLELEEPAAMKVVSTPLAMKQEEENLNFPVGIQIKTKASICDSKSRTEDFPSECSSSSPGTKTPNLVARLMGLDLLPECTSPSLISCSNSRPQKKSHLNQNHQRKDRNILQSRSNRCYFDDDIGVGARSSARRSDVEYHRLSLQINKENINEELALSSAKMVGRRGRFRQQPQDENRSPGHYAKQIVKQVKESVSRRVGLIDITNTNRDKEEIIRRDQNLLPKLTKRNSKFLPRLDGEISHDGKQSTTPSCSPKLRFLDTKKNKPVTDSSTKSPRNSTSSESYQGILNSLKPKHQVEHQQHKDNKKVGSGNTCRMKKLPHQTCDQAIRNKKEEPFVRSSAATNKVNLTDKKSKKAPLSSELLHISGPTLLPVKKDPSPPATKLPQKQSQVSDALSSKRNTQLSSNTSHSYKQLHLQPVKISTVPENVLPDNTNGCATTACASISAAAEYKCYIQKILKRTGIIDKFAPLTLGKWNTSSHPLDPSIFYYLELFHPTAAASASAATVLSRRCNRKLIFQLVDELLADILRPHLDFKPWISPIVGNIDHFGLVDEVCKKIESFPAANCQVLEDIDSLIDKDLCKSRLNGYFEFEGESLVSEIEGEIVEWLVSETVAMVGGAVRMGDGDRTGGCHVGSFPST